MSTIKKTGINLRIKILLAFTVFSIISLISVSSIALTSYDNIKNESLNESKQALTSQIQTDLNATTLKYALYISEKLNSIISQVNLTASIMEQLLSSSDFNGTLSYNSSNLNALGLGAFLDAEYKEYISLNHSCHLIPTSVSQTPSVLNLVNNSANIDPHLKTLVQTTESLRWIHFGFELGVYRGYPWHQLNPASYNFQAEQWYLSGKTLVPGMVSISIPYFNINFGNLVRFTRALYNSSGSFIGVLSAEYAINQMTQFVNDISYLQSGYAFMFDVNSNIFAHPMINDFTTGATITNLNANITSAVLQSIYSTLNGLTIVGNSTNSSGDYLSFQKVPNMQYYLALLVPVEEILIPVKELELQINQSAALIYIGIITALIICIIISSLLGLVIAGQITKPVKKITESVKKLTKLDAIPMIMTSDTEQLVDRSAQEQDDELGDLARAFKGMLDSIKEEDSKKSD